MGDEAIGALHAKGATCRGMKSKMLLLPHCGRYYCERYSDEKERLSL